MLSPSHKLQELTRNYSVPQAAQVLLGQNPPIMVAGATASGKSSVIRYIEQSSPYKHVVTHTTRRPRQGEDNGKNYWFVSNEQMLKLAEQNALIEINAVHGNTFYATSLMAYQKILDAGNQPLLVIDVQGIEDIIKWIPDARAAFILPPNFDAWMERLEGRGAMTHTEKLKRLRSARSELERALNERHFMLVVNHDITQVAKEILSGRTDGATQYENRRLAEALIDQIKHY